MGDRIPVVVEMLAIDGDLLGFDPLIGLDVIRQLGGVHINERGESNFPIKVPSISAAVVVKIKESDFEVEYDPTKKTRIANWKWSDDLPLER